MESISNQDAEKLLNQVRGESTAAMLAELFQKLNDKCFISCCGTNNSTIAEKEKKCLAKCMNLYQETYKNVASALMKQNST